MKKLRGLYGLLSGFCNSLIAFPQVFTQAVAVSLVPAIAAAFKVRDSHGVQENIRLGYRTTMIMAFPCAFGIFSLAEPILLLLYPAQKASAMAAVPTLMIMAVSVIFLAITQTSVGVLQSIGKQMVPVIHLAVGCVGKVVVTYVLVGVHSVNIKGAALGTMLAYIVALVLNNRSVKRYTGTKFNYNLTYVRPCVAAAIMGVCAYAAHKLSVGFLGNSIATLLAIMVGVVVYVILIFMLKAITLEGSKNNARRNKTGKNIEKVCKIMMKKKEYEELYLKKDKAGETLERLATIVEILRQQCPWDSVQTHETLKSCMIEEAYEAVEAINKKDPENLREELGDVLLQVVFHSNLAHEENCFDLNDVINEECEKMIRRHPHIFLDENVKTIDKALEKWDNMKSKEHQELRYTERLTGVPKALPALIRSSKVQNRAAKIGSDWVDVEGAFDKIREEFQELLKAYSQSDGNQIEEEFGDLLFSMVNASRFLNIDPEESLNQATEKFIKRFDCMEQNASNQGMDLADMTLDEMDKLVGSQEKISSMLL